jgi:hypothetical protein
MARMILAAAWMALAAACSDDGGQQLHDAPPSPVDAAVDGATQIPCFSGTPTTHEQIINACTSAQQVVKPNKPPLLRTDGSLPPLP